MKSIVIYFSQTGNTRQIAGAIQTGVSESNGKCDIARIQDVGNEDLQKYDLIGLGSPAFTDTRREMAARSRRLYDGETDLIPDLPVGREYHELYPGPGSTDRAGRRSSPEGALDMIDLRSFDLKINRERCNYPQCTVCIDNCPTGSINFSLSPPLFRQNCDRCFFCEQICPRGAIEVDWKPLADFVEKNVIDNWVTVAEEAVASGRLRRLVPPEEIGLKTSWYTVEKPPRLKPL